MSQFLVIPEQDKFPAYKTLSVTLAAGEIYTINQTFDAFAVLESSGTMKMSLDEQEESDFDAGIQMRAPMDKAFTTCRIRESGGAAANFRILLSFGNVRDSRFTASGNLNIQNAAAPNDSIQVDMLAADPGLVALAASIKGTHTLTDLRNLLNTIDADTGNLATILTALTGGATGRAALTTISGATFSNNTGEATVQTLVTAGANTAGIIVRLATASCKLDNPCYYGAGSAQPFCGFLGNGDATWVHDRVENLFIPSGVALVSRFTSTREGNIWYEVL